jgi:hypothetical protein
MLNQQGGHILVSLCNATSESWQIRGLAKSIQDKHNKASVYITDNHALHDGTSRPLGAYLRTATGCRKEDPKDNALMVLNCVAMKKAGKPQDSVGDGDETRALCFAQQLCATASALAGLGLVDGTGGTADVRWWYNDSRTPKVYARGYFHPPRGWVILIPRLSGCENAAGSIPRWTAYVEAVAKKFEHTDKVSFYYIVLPHQETAIKDRISMLSRSAFSATGGGIRSNGLETVRTAPISAKEIASKGMPTQDHNDPWSW